MSAPKILDPHQIQKCSSMIIKDNVVPWFTLKVISMIPLLLNFALNFDAADFHPDMSGKGESKIPEKNLVYT